MTMRCMETDTLSLTSFIINIKSRIFERYSSFAFDFLSTVAVMSPVELEVIEFVVKVVLPILVFLQVCA